MNRDEVLHLMGELIAGLHMPRSLGSPFVPPAYDRLRNAIRDSGWSNADELAERLRVALETPREPLPEDSLTEALTDLADTEGYISVPDALRAVRETEEFAEHARAWAEKRRAGVVTT